MTKQKKEFGLKEVIGLCIIIGVGVSSFVFAMYLLANIGELTLEDMPFWIIMVFIEFLLAGIGFVLLKWRLDSANDEESK